MSESLRLTSGGTTTRSGPDAPVGRVTQPSQTSSPVPKKIGRFEIRARLGAGGFGTVYQAHDPVLDREVALKVPHPHRLQTAGDRERALREARTAAKLHHPNIVTVYEAGVEGEQFFMATAFVEGQSLAEVLEARRFDFREAARIAIDLAHALDCAHQIGIIHRDVKPGNIMLDCNGRPLLTDFGLARFLESAERLTQEGAVLGTPAYMSPEQAQGLHDQVGPASDQYGLGVVLYQLLCGRLPFRGPVPAVISQVIASLPPSPRSIDPQVPAHLESICMKALAKNPADRYASCKALAQVLERWLGAPPNAAKSTRAVAQLGQWCRCHPALSIASATAALVLAFVLIAAVFQVIIHLRHREGPDTIVQVPEGAHVDLTKPGEIRVGVPRVFEESRQESAAKPVPGSSNVDRARDAQEAKSSETVEEPTQQPIAKPAHKTLEQAAPAPAITEVPVPSTDVPPPPSLADAETQLREFVKARPKTICDQGSATAFPAPINDDVQGLEVLGGCVWVLQGRTLHKLNGETGWLISEWKLPEDCRLVDLATDGESLYALAAEWPHAGPIYVISPENGQIVRTMSMDKSGAKGPRRKECGLGIAWIDQKLCVSSTEALYEVSPADGQVLGRKPCRLPFIGLAYDGTHLLMMECPPDLRAHGTVLLGAEWKGYLHCIDRVTGKIGRTVAINYPARQVAFDKGTLLIAEATLTACVQGKGEQRVAPETVMVYRLKFPLDITAEATPSDPHDRQVSKVPHVLHYKRTELCPAPADGDFSGMAVLDNEVWVLHEQELWLVNGDTGKVIATHRTPTDSNITAIAAEAGFIYAVPYGWTDGRPISVIDGQTGKTIREIETAANRNSNTYMPCGITCTQGRLFVFHDFEIISQVDAQSGEILKTIRTPYAVDPMLTHTDKHFALLGSAEIDGERCQAILLIDPTSGELVAGIPMPWESDVNCLAYHDGAFYTIDSAFRDDDGQDHPASICRWTPVNAE